jgi:glycopeptide antibiotics resistance protein
MHKFFFNLKLIFHIFNIIIICLYLFPGSLIGCFYYSNCGKQPTLVGDPSIPFNHVIAFALLSIFGILAYKYKLKFILIYLLTISIFLEVFHTIIPNRGYEFTDIAANVIGVLLAYIVFKIYDVSKKNFL